MPWFCHTAIGCNLDIDLVVLKTMRLSAAEIHYAQRDALYRLNVRQSGIQYTLNLKHSGDSRWEQHGPVKTTRAGPLVPRILFFLRAKPAGQAL